MAVKEWPDIPFAAVEGQELLLDLFLPDGVARPSLVVYVHGGRWLWGSRKKCPLAWLADHGCAVASISYRFTDKARFPAQIFDCKGAVRWLRAHAAEYGCAAERIAVAGSSAGGHLAVLLGTSADDEDLEGEVGGNLDYSSRVQAVIDYYGPTDFILRAQTQPHKTEIPGSPVFQLLGGPVGGNEAAARRASGAWHVTRSAAPLLIFHGTADQTVLMDQAQRIYDVYRQHNLDVALHVVEGAKHGGDEYYSPANRRHVVQFLARHLGSPA